MADVTGAPVPTGSSPFDVPGDLADLADHFGDADFFAVDTASALPMTGNWVKRRMKARDTGVEYVWSGSTWQAAPWTNLTLNSGWDAYASETPRYRVVDGVAYFNGRVRTTSNSAGAVIGVIPSAIRPVSAGNVFVFTGWSDTHGIVQLLVGHTSGEVVCVQGAGAARSGISLANIQFPVG